MRRAVWVLVLSVLWSGTAGAELIRWDEHRRPGLSASVEADGRTRLALYLWSARPPEGSLVRLTVRSTGAAERVVVFPVRDGQASTTMDLPDELFHASITLVDAAGHELSAPYLESFWGSDCGPAATYVGGGPLTEYDVVAALRVPPPRWPGAPQVEPLQVLSSGEAFSRLHLPVIPEQRMGLVRVHVRKPHGHELFHCIAGFDLYSSPVQLMLRLPQARNWPDHILADLTLLDAAGRSSDTRTVEVPVVRHHDDPPECDESPLYARVLLFLPLPFLVGFLVVSILRRRRR